MMISIRYASHLPVLTKIVEATTGPILELGTGLCSTPYLHWMCFVNKRKLTSYVYKLFKYRFDYTLAIPNTTVVSNFVDLENFNV